MATDFFHVTYRPEHGLEDLELERDLSLIARAISADPDFFDIEISEDLTIHGPATPDIVEAITDKLVDHLNAIESHALH